MIPVESGSKETMNDDGRDGLAKKVITQTQR